jgi:hypothetical protein
MYKEIFKLYYCLNIISDSYETSFLHISIAVELRVAV